LQISLGLVYTSSFRQKMGKFLTVLPFFK
jgi:hypothetical protein